MSPRWHTSLRFRLLVLAGVVAVCASGLTAWLTVYQASQQASSDAAAEEATAKSIVDEIAGYGALRGNWDGVSGTVRALTDRTGQRIRLTTLSGQLLADSDTLNGGQARPVGNRAPVLVDPVPTPVPPGGVEDGFLSFRTNSAVPLTTSLFPPTSPSGGSSSLEPVKAREEWLSRLFNYAWAVRLGRCLIGKGFLVEQQARPDGIPRVDLYGPAPDEARGQAIKTCTGDLRGVPDNTLPMAACVAAGSKRGAGAGGNCLVSSFRDQLQEFMPAPLLLSLGAGEGPPSRQVPLLPALLAATGVALVATLGMWLVSRRVLRPVGALRTAATRLGAGELAERVPVRGDDEIADLAGAFNRMADSLQRSEERQRRMIADIAHELRTPLANIRGYLEALKDGVLPPDPELFASLHEEALLQQRLIEDIQLLALADAGSLAYERRPVDLGEIVAATRTGFQAVAAEAGVELASTVDDPAPVVAGDANRLRQVLGNLVSNAIRATPAGGLVRLTARTEGDRAVLVVADTGAGIQAEDLPFVFDRFWRADDARARATGGSGLGLSIAREIVTAHGGTITAESPGGAVFTVRLPRG